MDFTLTPAQKLLQQTAKELAEFYFAPEAYTWESRQEFPRSSLRTLAEHGFTGMVLPVEDGGQGMSLFDAVLVMEQVAQVCPHTGDCFHLANFGAICQIAAFASPEVKRRVLPELLSGERLAVIAMSEPEAGSAVTDLRTRARYEGDWVVVNGAKVFNSEGPHADWWVVWVRFGDHPRDTGAVLVERGTPGFFLGKTSYFMPGVQYCSLHFDECRVPRDYVLLDQDGFRKMLNVFNIERIGNATRSLALGQVAFDMAVTYAQERRQFGRPLCEFQGLQWKFADMKMKLDAARLLIYRAASNSDANQGIPNSLEVAIAKCYANQVGFEVANDALQIFGGYGYDRDSRISYIFRRTRGWMIAGGTVEIMKNRIAREIFARRFSQRP